MTKKQKKLIAVAAGISLSLCFAPAAGAMHIMEGYLPVRYCIAWGILCVPFLIAGFWSIKKSVSEQGKPWLFLQCAEPMHSFCPH